MENKDNSIINSLKRLERVGGENSRVTRKLKKACCEVGKKIVELIKVYCEDEKNRFYCDVFPEIELPRGYKAIYISTNDTTRWTIMVPGQDPYEQHPYDRSLAYCPQDILRSDALQFSKDIAEGMLEEIVDWLEEKTAQINKAQEAIDKVEIK